MLTRKKEASGVKYSPINQFIKVCTTSLVVNSYLSDNLEDKQLYFTLDTFSTDRSLNLGSKLRFKL